MSKPAQVTEGEEQSQVHLTPEPAVGSTISWSPYASDAMDRSRQSLLLVFMPPPSPKSQDSKDGLPCDPPPYVMSILQTQVGIFLKCKASFSGVGGYVGNASEELACKLKDTISHYWGVWKGLSDKEGKKSRIQNSRQTARLCAFEGCVPRLSRASGKEGVNISLFVFLYLNGYMYIS